MRRKRYITIGIVIVALLFCLVLFACENKKEKDNGKKTSGLTIEKENDNNKEELFEDELSNEVSKDVTKDETSVIDDSTPGHLETKEETEKEGESFDKIMGNGTSDKPAEEPNDNQSEQPDEGVEGGLDKEVQDDSSGNKWGQLF